MMQLLDERMKKRTYLLGIYVCEAKNVLPDLGINFQKKDIVNIGRDRNIIPEHKIVLAVARALSSMPRLKVCGHVKPSRDCQNCRSFYVLNKYYHLLKSNNVGYLFDSYFSSSSPELSENFLDVFVYNEGTSAVPATKEEMDVNHSDAALLGLTLVECCGALRKLLHKSSRCPSIEKGIESRARDYLAVPELVLDDNHGRNIPYPVKGYTVLPTDYAFIAERIYELVRRAFNKFTSPEFIRFKDFVKCASQNSKQIIKVKYEAQYYYLIDLRFFLKETVHAYFKQCMPEFSCPGKCGCILTYASECLIATVHGAQRDKMNIERRIKMWLMQGPEISSTPNEAARHSIPQRRADNSSPACQQPSNSPVLVRETRNGYESPGNASGHTHRQHKSIPTQRRVMTDEEVVQYVIQATQKQKPIPFANANERDSSGPPAAIRNEKWQCKPESKVYYPLCGIGGLCVVRQEGKPNPKVDNSYEAFSFFLTALAIEVFQVNITQASGKQIENLNIFMDNSDTIAFNLGKRLFFNISYYKPSQPFRTHASFWFSIFCHELAHNAYQDHDAKHSSLMTTLHTNFLPTFVDFCQLHSQ